MEARTRSLRAERRKPSPRRRGPDAPQERGCKGRAREGKGGGRRPPGDEPARNHERKRPATHACINFELLQTNCVQWRLSESEQKPTSTPKQPPRFLPRERVAAANEASPIVLLRYVFITTIMPLIYDYFPLVLGRFDVCEVCIVCFYV